MDVSPIKTLIERALVDGRLSSKESQTIKAAIYADDQVTTEEYELFRELQDKIWKGEICLED